MSYDKQKLSKYLREMFQATNDDLRDEDKDNLFVILGGEGTRIELTTEEGRSFVGQTPDNGQPSLYVLQAGGIAQKAFVDECLKDREFASQIGADALINKLHDVLKRFFTKEVDKLDLSEIVKKEILQSLRSEVSEWCVRVPINNLKIDKTFKIGSVTFVRHEDGVISNAEIILNWNGPPDDAARTITTKVQMMNVLAAVSQQGTAWAVADIQSHQNRASDVAREQIEVAINTVRAFTHVFHPHNTRAGFGLPYEIAGRPTGFIANAGTNFAIQMDNRGVLIPFALTDSMINRLQTDFSFDALDRIAAANWKELNTLEQAIRVAVQWLGRSVIALTLAEAFTQCTIAIERLLILNGEDTTVERFAERLMYLLSDKPAERAFIYKAAKRLYDIRSKVVHAGFDSVELQQLQEIESFALHALRNTLLLHGKLKDHEALRSYLHDRKVGHTEAIEVAESKTGITE